MERTEILAKIQAAMASLFELDPADVTPEATLGEDLDLDSIDAIDLIIKMQDLTDEKIDPEAMSKVRTVGDIVDIVEGMLNGR